MDAYPNPDILMLKSILFAQKITKTEKLCAICESYELKNNKTVFVLAGGRW